MAANTVRAMREKMLQVSDDALYKEGNGQLTAKERAKRVLRMCKPGHDEYQNLMKPITSSDLQMVGNLNELLKLEYEFQNLKSFATTELA